LDTTLIWNLVLVAIFIVLTAFFVGAEFSVVKLRMSKIEQLIDQGNKSAVIAKKLVDNLDYYLSACQLGITVTALALGTLSKPTVKELLYPVFAYFNVSESLTDVLNTPSHLPLLHSYT
jgi:CBS domain containing-hemolysin-like protein